MYTDICSFHKATVFNNQNYSSIFIIVKPLQVKFKNFKTKTVTLFHQKWLISRCSVD